MSKPLNKATRKTSAQISSLANPFLLLFILLNCAKNSNATITTIEHYAKNLECIALCLQEQWCDTNKTPPTHPDFESFYSSSAFSKMRNLYSKVTTN
jgi:hypothetical protein